MAGGIAEQEPKNQISYRQYSSDNSNSQGYNVSAPSSPQSPCNGGVFLSTNSSKLFVLILVAPTRYLFSSCDTSLCKLIDEVEYVETLGV